MIKVLKTIFLGLLLVACSNNKVDKKGFQVREISEDETGKKIVGLPIDSLTLETRPRNVLLTFDKRHRLTPIYKVNYHKKTKKPFIGSNAFHTQWYAEYDEGNNWNQNFMPGFKAVYGYNFVNVSHYDNELGLENKLFDRPVLIKTLYYPSSSKDTLNFNEVKRDYYMISVYDEDTNKDGYINMKDLRRFYLFDIHGKKIKELVPKDHSVMSSEYDSANDYMYIFARLDKNGNGQMESKEPINIFWIDLNDPHQIGKQYTSDFNTSN